MEGFDLRLHYITLLLGWSLLGILAGFLFGFWLFGLCDLPIALIVLLTKGLNRKRSLVRALATRTSD